MPDMTTALRHLGWSDSRLMSEPIWSRPGVLELPADSGGRTVADLLAHIVDGAQWYCYCLNELPLAPVDSPRDANDVLRLAEVLSRLNGSLASAAALPDQDLKVDDNGTSLHVTRSMILAQACYHSTEHRTQIDAALRAAGIPGLDLDAYDLWSFLSS